MQPPASQSLPIPSDDIPCIACGATETRPFAVVDAFTVQVCRRCGLGRTVPQPSNVVLHDLYAGDYAASARKFSRLIEAGRRAFARAFAARVARRAGAGGRVLDVGCGDGKVLVALWRRGYACDGTELNPRIGEHLPPEIAVHRGMVEDAHFPPRAFRIVILRHVLEHVRDPLPTLREVRRVIADDGHLIIAVPNLASWQARLTAEQWFHLDLPRHLWHFSPTALRAVLAATGFDVVRLSHVSFEQNPYGWLQSGFNVLGGRWRELYDQFRSPAATYARAVDPLAVAGAALLLPVSVALASVESLAGRGGTVEVWARPR